MIDMGRERFEELVSDALDTVPGELLDLVDNCVVLVEDEPPADDPDLLGLYDGIALTERDSSYTMVAPDRILVYLLVAAILGFVGYRKVRKVRGPERAIAQAQETKETLLRRG